jgi:hypothetical protein
MNNRLFLSTRCHASSVPTSSTCNGDRVRSIFGYEVVYRCLTTTTSISPLSPSICNNMNANGGIAVGSASSKDFWQQQRQRQEQQIRQRRSSQIIIDSYPSLRRCNNNASDNDQDQYHQRFQFRCFAFDSRKVRKRKKTKNPFKVLKVKEGMLYKDVKLKFLKIAMNNHPDTYRADDDISEKEQENMRNTFIDARIAFESLTEDTDGTAILVTDKVDEEANFDSWFKNETGLKNPFDLDIDPETMKEVAKMTEDMGGDQGLDRDGGSKWILLLLLLLLLSLLLLYCTFVAVAVDVAVAVAVAVDVDVIRYSMLL